MIKKNQSDGNSERVFRNERKISFNQLKRQRHPLKTN